MERPIRYCYWVVPGKLLAGEYPREKDDEPSVAKVRALTDAGVTTFVDLTVEGEGYDGPLKPYDHLASPATHRRFPIVDMCVPTSRDCAANALDAIDHTIEAGGIAYVHCLGGIGRTGTIIGCWLVRHGRSGEEALRHLAELWRHNPKSRFSYARHSPQTHQQCDYVRDWREEE